jgi:hypothetical protein
VSKLRYDGQRGFVPQLAATRQLPACEGSRHFGPGMYLGVDGRYYVGGAVQAKCPSCHQPLPTIP